MLLVDRMDGISKNQAMSYKVERRRKYSMAFKKVIIKHAQDYSIYSAAKKFKVDRKRVP